MSPYLRISWRVTVFLGLAMGGLLSRAQDTNVPTDAAPTQPDTAQPSFTTNTPPTSSFDSRSEGVSGQSTLSLRPTPEPESPSIGPSTPTASPTPEPFNLMDPNQEAEDLAKHLLVVYNRNDSDSEDLAEYYASKRNIPAERVLGISCSQKEEISRNEFEDTIRQPILFYLLRKNWMARKNAEAHLGARIVRLLVATHNDIWAIVLIRGVPLKVAPDPSDDDMMENEAFFKSGGITLDSGVANLFRTNAAAVDSELAMLPIFGLPKGGFVPNVFFDGHGNGARRVGAELAQHMILVTRLDGPTPANVRRMIDDSLWAEKNRLAGLAVIDTCGINDPKNGKFAGDAWLRNANGMLLRDGWTVKIDNKPDVLPATDTSNQVAIYLGWYSGTAEGPWVSPPNRFVPGAIAYHLHSFSAATVRSATSNWVGPLIAHGADATMGTVYEPLLGWTPHEDIFTKRMLMGHYFAESAYASIQGLSWMVTVVGDPLYRPFREPLDEALAKAKTPHTDHDDWLFLQQLRREIATGKIDSSTGQLQITFTIPDAGPVADEGLADVIALIRGSKTDSAIESAYRKAMATYRLPIDRIRVGIKLADYYKDHDQASRAQSQIDMLREQFPEDSDRFGLTPPVAAAPNVSPPPSTQTQTSSPPKTKPAGDAAASTKPPAPPKPPMPPFPKPATDAP